MEKTISKQAQDDKALIASLQNGSAREKTSAFNALYKKHQRQMLSFFLRRGLEVEDAEDALMVTFTKVHSNIGEYDSEKSVFSTWLSKIAQNTFIDAMRRKNFELISLEALSFSRELDGENYNTFQIPSETLIADEVMIRDENIQIVREAISEMGGDMQTMMELRFLKEMKYAEIAETMDIEDNSTLRVTIKRGKEKLMNALLEEK